MDYKSNSNPYASAGLFSRIFSCWLFPLLKEGRKRCLREDDLYEILKGHSSEYLGDLLEKEWNKETIKKNPSLIKALFRFIGWKHFAVIIFISFIQEIVVIPIQPFLLGKIVKYFDKKSEINEITAYLSLAGFCALCAINGFSYNMNFFITDILGMKLKVSLCTATYKKALNLSPCSLGKCNKGQMVNLLGNDVSKFYNLMYSLPYLITSPLVVIIMVVRLWQYYGWTILVGIAVICLYFPMQILFGKIYSKLRLQSAVLGDERMNLLNQLLSGMRLIKMYTWELPYISLIENIRKKEMSTVRKFVFVRGTSPALGYPITRLFCCLTFLTFFLTGGNLNAETVFVTMNFSIYICFSVTGIFSFAISQISEILVSLKRLQDFLLLEEKDNNSIQIEDAQLKLHKYGIWVKNVTAAWNKDTKIMNGMSLNIKHGELLIITGTVGSGKTSVLMSMLGEIPISSGKIIINGKISYACQESWIFNGTIRENILFGEEYEEEKYRKILHITALEKDISIFPKGDMTSVAERGVIMSGGQKARINLARALYRDADIFILDDPLSAVDIPVAKHIFNKCILQYLKDKICILVTHQIQFLNHASKVLVLKEGKYEVINNYNKIENLQTTTGISSELENVKNFIEKAVLSFNNEKTTNNNQVLPDISEINMPNVAKLDTQILDEEVTRFRMVGLSAYKEYINAGAGFFFTSIILFMLFLSQFAFIGSDYCLINWFQEKRIYNQRIENIGNFSSEMKFFNQTEVKNIQEIRQSNIFIYCGLICATLLITYSSAALIYEVFVRASTNLHNKMLRCIIRTPISFLDNNPRGILLNRFSKDINNMDDTLVYVFYDAIRGVCLFIGMFVVEAIVCPYLLIFSCILLILLYFLWTLHNRILKSLKELEGKLRSPVFSHLSESLYGLITIRSFKAENNFKTTFNKYQDKHTATWFLLVTLNRFLSSYTQILCFINIIVISIFSSSFITDNAGPKIGLAMNYGLLTFLFFQWLIRQSSETEYLMNSVACIQNYSKLKSEAAYETPSDRQPPVDWPRKGEIDFHNVSLQYSNDDNSVLHNVTFRVHSGEKIGIVGRTGAGKSSIIAALFRMTEPTGTITIDGVVTKDIGLRDLRCKISIIPQEPMLFTGPLRRNIDPFNEYSEEMIWSVLEEVQLKEFIGGLPGGMDSHLMEGGSNFSVGQRQLICLARAILRQNKILVMDEATSNIDKFTDSCIQKIIREKFRSCTVLTIAHRLQTIIDSDRILVINKGRIEEFDKPFLLLQDVNSMFYNLVKYAGPTTVEELYKAAKNKYYGKGH